MRKFLVFAASIAAMVGCTKQFVDTPDTVGGSSEVGFDTYVANPTKGVAKSGFVMGDQFFVYGGRTGTENFNVAAPSFTEWVFDVANFPKLGATVSNYGNNVWRYSPVATWDDQKVTFFGFSPVPTATETYGITMANPANLTTIPEIEFAVKGGYAVGATADDIAASRLLTKEQVDLLWVATPDQSKGTPTVAMMFKHALTRLNFSVRSQAPAGTVIRINEITLKNAVVNGKLALAHDETSKGNLDYIGGWKAAATPEKKNFAINLINSEASLIKDNAVHNITDDDEALMMIPQSLTGLEIEFKYAYSADNGVTWENYETGAATTVKLDQGTNTHWNPNKQIRYILNVVPGETIGFTADVEAWGAEDNIEFISKGVSQLAQDITKMNLKANDEISVITGGDWITYTTGGVTNDLTTTPIKVAADGEYTFAAKANILTSGREDQIIIESKDAVTGAVKQVVIKVVQAAGTGTIKVAQGAGEVATFSLKNGDKISVPQTKAAAAWVLGKGAEIASEYTASADEKYVISVEKNEGAARAATISVTTNGTTVEYTIEQAGVKQSYIDVESPAGRAYDGLKDDVITYVSGGGVWFTVKYTDGTEKEVSGTITATDDYKLMVTKNPSTASRVAVFRVESAGVVTQYTLTQKGDVAPKAVTVTMEADGTYGPTVNLKDYTISATSAGATWLLVDAVAISDVFVSGAGVLSAETNTGAARTATFTATKGAEIINYTVNQAAGAVPPVEVPVNLPAGGGEVLAATSFVAGDIIELVSGDAELEYTVDGGSATTLSGTITISTPGEYVITAKANATIAAKTAVVKVTKSGVVTNYNVNVAAFVPTPTDQVIAVAQDGTFTPTLTLAGETISDMSNCDWLLVDGAAMAAGAATGAVTAPANDSGSERVATFVVTATDGLSAIKYTVTQAEV